MAQPCSVNTNELAQDGQSVWIEHTDRQGSIYYVNRETGKAQVASFFFLTLTYSYMAVRTGFLSQWVNPHLGQYTYEEPPHWFMCCFSSKKTSTAPKEEPKTQEQLAKEDEITKHEVLKVCVLLYC